MINSDDISEIKSLRSSLEENMNVLVSIMYCGSLATGDDNMNKHYCYA